MQVILHFAEFGVVLMLFLVGLKLEPKRRWNLRRPIFGWGSTLGQSTHAARQTAMRFRLHNLALFEQLYPPTKTAPK